MKSDLGWLITPYGFADKEKKRLDGPEDNFGLWYQPCNFSFLGIHELRLFNYFAFMNVYIVCFEHDLCNNMPYRIGGAILICINDNYMCIIIIIIFVI